MDIGHGHRFSDHKFLAEENKSLALTWEVSLDTQSSDSSAEEIK